MARMKLSDNTKTVLTAVGVVSAIVGTIVIANKIKKSRWGKGKKRPPKDMKFDPKKQKRMAYVGDQGYVNVRSSAEIKELPTTLGAADLDFSDKWKVLMNPLLINDKKFLAYVRKKYTNLIGRISQGVVGEIIGEQQGKKYYWYKVKNSKGITGFVREDVVIVKVLDK